MHKNNRTLALTLVAVSWFGSPALSQSDMPATGGPDGIVVLPPEVVVYQQGLGVRETMPDLTREANRNLEAAARVMLQKDARFRLVDAPQLDEPTGAVLREHVELFKVIANDLNFTVKMGGKPFAANRDYPDYRVGSGLRFLREQTGARYAFVLAGAEVRETGGKVFFSLLAAGLAGVYVGGGGSYLYAGILDLESGQVRWFNSHMGVAVFGVGGKNASTETGANKSLENMFATYPASPGLNFQAVPLEATSAAPAASEAQPSEPPGT